MKRHDEDEAARLFAVHLAAHAVAEYMLRGSVSKTIDTSAPCPYCGKLPPTKALLS